MEPVKECSMVTIEYTLRTISPDGEVQESPNQSCSFVYGVHVQYPSVEAALRDRLPGEKIRVSVPPEEVFGVHDETLVRELPREDYDERRLAPGKMYRQIRRKCMVQFMVKELKEAVVVADFNDPQVGTRAEFDILVKEVRPATKDELKPSCATG